MSVELQTGTECLVSDASDAELYAGIQGAGNYILRKPLELSMIDSNTLSVGAGTGLQNGRHIRFKGTTEFSIPSGVQAQKRSNIAVVRTTISRDESTMKTLTHSEPIVLSGEPVAEGDPVDPAWIEGDLLAGDTVADFPIARVVTDGINVGEPEPLFDVLQSAKDRWDSQCQEWLWQSQQYPDYGILATRWGRLVIIHINLVNVGIEVTREGTTLCTLPEHLQPMAIPNANSILTSSTLTAGTIQITSDGRLVGATSDVDIARYFCGEIAYLV